MSTHTVKGPKGLYSVLSTRDKYARETSYYMLVTINGYPSFPVYDEEEASDLIHGESSPADYGVPRLLDRNPDNEP